MNPQLRTGVVAGVFLAIAALFALAAATSTPTAHASPVQFADTGWPDVLAVADTTRTAADAIPARYAVDQQISRSSLALAHTATADYWIAVGSDGRLCLVVAFPGKLSIAATTCTDQRSFEAQGLALQAHTANGSVVAYVLPDSSAGAVPSDTLAYAAPNLLVGDPFDTAREGAGLAPASTSRQKVIDLPQFTAPEDF